MPRLRAPAGLLLLVASLPAQDREDFRVGLGLQERGLHREAAKAFERFVAATPEAAEATEAWYRLGVCREELGKAAEAGKAYEAMLAGDKEFRHRAEGRYRLGRLLQAAGKPADAIVQLEALLEEAGQRHYLAPAACFALGECREAKGEEAEALAAYDRTAALAPKGELAFPALYKAGHLALAADEPLAAATRFGKAADGFPRHEAATECRYLQGLALVRGGRDRQAEAALVRVTEGPWADDAMLALADCLDRRGDEDGALRVLAELRRRHPDSPLGARALERTAFARLQAGKSDEAAALFGQALAALGRDAAAAPARSRCLYGLAEARVALGNDAEAVGAYAEAEKLSQDKALRGDAAYGAMFALHRLGRHRESLRIAKAFAGEYPGHRLGLQARFAVAENLWALEDWAGARAAYAATAAAAAVAGAEPAAAASARALADQCRYKVAWCDWLREQPGDAAKGFGAIADRDEVDASLREEALAMQVLALWKAGDADAALTRADLYRARHPRGGHLPQTERVAAQALRKRGEGEAAEQRLARAAKLSSGTDAAADRLEVADLKLERGDFRGAEAIYQALLGELPQAAGAGGNGADGGGLLRFRAVEGLAWCAFELGRTDRCRELGGQALGMPQAAAHGAGLLELLCGIELDGGRFAEAEAYARAFLERYARHAHAPRMRFHLGLALARGGKTAEARRVLEALARDQDAADLRRDRVWYELAWLERKAGRERQALAAFAKVAELGEDPALAGEARLHLAEAATAAGDHAEAAKQLAAVEGRYKSRALHRLGFVRFEKRQLEDALRAFEALAALEPADEWVEVAPFLCAECRYELEQWGEAAALYRRFLEGHGEHERAQRARLHLGRAALEAGEAGEAAAQLRAWLARAPQVGEEKRAAADGAPADEGAAERADHARALLWLGRAELGRKRWPQAVEALTRATKLATGSLAAESWFRLGEARRGDGDADGAIEAFVRLSILWDDPTWSPRALYEAGLLFEAAENPDGARKLYEELRQRYPKSDQAGDAAKRLRKLGR